MLWFLLVLIFFLSLPSLSTLPTPLVAPLPQHLPLPYPSTSPTPTFWRAGTVQNLRSHTLDKYSRTKLHIQNNFVLLLMLFLLLFSVSDYLIFYLKIYFGFFVWFCFFKEMYLSSEFWPTFIHKSSIFQNTKRNLPDSEHSPWRPHTQGRAGDIFTQLSPFLPECHSGLDKEVRCCQVRGDRLSCHLPRFSLAKSTAFLGPHWVRVHFPGRKKMQFT